MIKKDKGKSREKIIWQLFCKRVGEETYLIYSLGGAFVYLFISMLISRYCSCCTNPPLIWLSVDGFLRNFSYGLITSILFYYLIDFFRNVKKNVDTYNEMFPDLYNLWLKAFQLILEVSDFKYKDSYSEEEALNIIYKNISGHKIGETNALCDRIDIGVFHSLMVSWSEVNNRRKKFLDVYGSTISREEYSKLVDYEFITSVDYLAETMPSVEHFEKGMTVVVNSREMQHTIYLIWMCKSYLTEMVNKYSEYYYGNSYNIRIDMLKLYVEDGKTSKQIKMKKYFKVFSFFSNFAEEIHKQVQSKNSKNDSKRE